MSKKQRVPVSESGLIQRINRRLAADDEALRKTKGGRGDGVPRARLDLGEFYILNTRRNFVRDKHVDLEKLGRELDVLQSWEYLA
jgi:hypothetical protein